MTEIINFKSARKKVKRKEKEKTAEENRIKFGTPKSLKKHIKVERALAEKNLEAKKLVSENSGISLDSDIKQ